VPDPHNDNENDTVGTVVLTWLSPCQVNQQSQHNRGLRSSRVRIM